MQRFIQLFLATAVVVSLLVLNAAASNDGLAGSSAAKRRMTNAERLARGLPPNPPAARYTPGLMRARDGASATTTSSSSTTSSSPSTTPTPPVNCNATGYFTNPWSTIAPYVGLEDNQGPPRTFTIVEDIANAVLVTFNNCSTGPVNIECLSCSSDGPSFIGVAEPGSIDFTPVTGMTRYGGFLTLTDPAPRGPVSQNPSLCESAVWLFNSTTSALALTWVNSNNSAVNLALSLYGDGDDLAAFYSVAESFDLTFVPL